MRKVLYILLLLIALISCEEAYHPDIEEVDNMLVVEAVLISTRVQNTIHIYRSHGFNSDDKTYPGVSGARVSLIDDKGYSTECFESGSGVYILNHNFQSDRNYHLSIEVDGNLYESGIQAVPPTPEVDSFYFTHETRISIKGDANSKDDLLEEYGIRILTDISEKSNISHYRFSGKKLIQYTDTYDTIIMAPPPVTLPIYIWRTMGLSGTFNIAGPPEYSASKNIIRHDLEFFESNYYKYIPDTLSFAGWIYFIYQYGINEDTYYYYKDLNSQLNAEGKIFDPVYVQVQGNIKCTSDPGQVVLGNFEISSFKEHRCFLTYYRNYDNTWFKEIPYFYDIPGSGDVKDIMPDFWERIFKTYPDE
jgi:hypothetical protein